MWLSLTMLVACTWDNDPDAPVLGLSHFSAAKVGFHANPRQVFVVIETDAFGVGACPILEDGFRAAVNGVAMEITSRGESLDSIYASEPCRWPTMNLDGPPIGADAVIAISYPGHAIQVGLADLLAPRSAHLVPDGPWTFTPGQTITLQWSPKEDFAIYTPTVDFVTDDSLQTGIRYTYLQAAITDDRMTFALPTETLPGKLEVAMQKSSQVYIDWPRCDGASCQLVQTPQWVQPIAWKSSVAAAGP